MGGGDSFLAGVERVILFPVRASVYLCPNFLACLSMLRTESGRLIFLLSC